MAFSDGRDWFAQGWFATGYWNPGWWAGAPAPPAPATAVDLSLRPAHSRLIPTPLPTPVNMWRTVRGT